MTKQKTPIIDKFIAYMSQFKHPPFEAYKHPYHKIDVTEVLEIPLASMSWDIYCVLQETQTVLKYNAALAIRNHLSKKYDNASLTTLYSVSNDQSATLTNLNIKFQTSEDKLMPVLYDVFPTSLGYEILIYRILPEINRHKAAMDRNYIPRTFLGYLRYTLIN